MNPDLETLALVPYLDTGIDPADPPPIFALIKAFVGITVERPRNMIGPRAKRYQFQGREVIAVRRDLPIEYAHFSAAHELAHILLNALGYPGDQEDAANYLGAALLMPRVVVQTYGVDPQALAEATVCTQTAATLRIFDALSTPGAAVSPEAVRIRGAFEWPEEATVRRWAKRPPLGLRKIRLTDQPKRVALVADDV